MISDELVSLETAKLAKEKGFNWLCSSVKIETIEGSEREVYYEEECRYITVKDVIKTRIPTQTRLQRWLIEEKKMYVCPSIISDYEDDFSPDIVYWSFIIVNTESGDSIYIEYERVDDKRFDTYEQALEDALKYALENFV